MILTFRQIIDDALDKRPNLRLRPYEKDNVLDILRSYKMTGKETEPPLIVKQTVRFPFDCGEVEQKIVTTSAELNKTIVEFPRQGTHFPIYYNSQFIQYFADCLHRPHLAIVLQ